MKSQSSWVDIAGLIIVVVVLIGIALTAFYFLWGGFLDIPDLTYEVSSVKSDSEGGFINTISVYNEGRRSAHLVRLWLHDLGTVVDAIDVEKDGPWDKKGGGEGQDNLLIEWERLADRSTAKVQFSTPYSVELKFGENLYVESEEGKARDRSQPRPKFLEEICLGSIGLIALVTLLVISPLVVGRIAEGSPKSRR